MSEIGTYLIKDRALTSKECMRRIKYSGFEFVCVGMNDILNEDGQGVTPDFAAQTGLEIENVHLNGAGTNAIWREGTAGDAITERYCREIQICSKLGIKTGVAHVTWGIESPPRVSQIGLERFLMIAECAEKYQFKLALENSVSPQHLRFLLDRIDSNYVGFCFDSGHRNCFSPTEDFLTDYGKRLFAMHLQDNDGWRDLHMIPMDGCIPWSDVIKSLDGTSLYHRRITLETAGKIHRRCPGQSAPEIEKGLERLNILHNSSLLKIKDEMFEIYSDLTYEEYLERVFAAGLKIAGRN